MSDRPTEHVVVVTRRERLVEKSCLVCGQSFFGLNRRRYCSQSCANRAAYVRYADERRAARRTRYRARKAGPAQT